MLNSQLTENILKIIHYSLNLLNIINLLSQHWINIKMIWNFEYTFRSNSLLLTLFDIIHPTTKNIIFLRKKITKRHKVKCKTKGIWYLQHAIYASWAVILSTSPHSKFLCSYRFCYVSTILNQSCRFCNNYLKKITRFLRY